MSGRDYHSPGNERLKKEYKLQFRFSTDAVERLDSIARKTRSSTRAEVIRNALRLYEYILDQTEGGYQVQLVKGREKKTIVLFPTGIE